MKLNIYDDFKFKKPFGLHGSYKFTLTRKNNNNVNVAPILNLIRVIFELVWWICIVNILAKFQNNRVNRVHKGTRTDGQTDVMGTTIAVSEIG